MVFSRYAHLHLSPGTIILCLSLSLSTLYICLPLWLYLIGLLNFTMTSASSSSFSILIHLCSTRVIRWSFARLFNRAHSMIACVVLCRDVHGWIYIRRGRSERTNERQRQIIQCERHHDCSWLFKSIVADENRQRRILPHLFTWRRRLLSNWIPGCYLRRLTSVAHRTCSAGTEGNRFHPSDIMFRVIKHRQRGIIVREKLILFFFSCFSLSLSLCVFRRRASIQWSIYLHLCYCCMCACDCIPYTHDS